MVFESMHVEIDNKIIGTGGLCGFLTGLLLMHSKYGGRLIICWDGKRNFRKGLYPAYKAKRVSSPEMLEKYLDVDKQQKRTQAFLRCLGVKQYVAIHCEADDVIGTLCEQNKNKRIIIFSADSDMRQLVNSWVTVVAPGKGKDVIYTSRSVKNRHQVGPNLIPDLKALAGDPSDGIPGVSGIGPQKAVALLKDFGSVEKIVKAAKDPSFWEDAFWPVSEKLRKNITESANDLLLFKVLTTIKKDAEYKEIKSKKSFKTAVDYLKMYQLKSLYSPLELKKLSLLSKA